MVSYVRKPRLLSGPCTSHTSATEQPWPGTHSPPLRELQGWGGCHLTLVFKPLSPQQDWGVGRGRGGKGRAAAQWPPVPTAQARQPQVPAHIPQERVGAGASA